MDWDDLVRWGSLAGIAGALTFSILWVAAIIVDGNWLFGLETLSELGGDRPGRWFFNGGVVVMGALALPFGAALYHKLCVCSLGKISSLMFMLAAVFLIGVGLFPIDTGAPHTFFSWAFFSTAIISLTFMLPPFHQVVCLSHVSLVATAGVVLTGYVTIILVATDLMELALSEALVVIALNLWVLIVGASMLRQV